MIVTSARGVPAGVRQPGMGFWAVLAQLGTSLLGQSNAPAPEMAEPGGSGLIIGGAIAGLAAAGALVYFLVRDPKGSRS